MGTAYVMYLPACASLWNKKDPFLPRLFVFPRRTSLKCSFTLSDGSRLNSFLGWSLEAKTNHVRLGMQLLSRQTTLYSSCLESGILLTPRT